MDKVKIDNADYEGKEISIDPVRAQDDLPDGKARVIREFIFAFNPETVQKIRNKQMETVSKQGLFNAHVKQIEIMLWGDGLVFDTEFEPRIVIGKKKYKIVIVCKPRQGVLLGNNKPLSLSQALSG